MKTITLLLLFAATCLCQSSHQDRLEAKDAATKNLANCTVNPLWDCSAERRAYRDAVEAFEQSITSNLSADNADIRQITLDLQAITARIDAYKACRAGRRWWNVWRKRCQL